MYCDMFSTFVMSSIEGIMKIDMYAKFIMVDYLKATGAEVAI